MRPLLLSLLLPSALSLAACQTSSPGTAPASSGAPASQVPSAGIAERTGVIHRAGAPLTVLGPDLKVGDPAPQIDLIDTDMKPLTTADLRGKVVVLSVVPSLDTPVCERQTGEIARRQADLPADTVVLTVSRDLPFAQKRVLETNQISTRAASDYREGSFGRAYGVLVKETQLLARSVWVIDKTSRITYREIVADQKTEPSYEPLMEAVRKATGGS